MCVVIADIDWAHAMFLALVYAWMGIFVIHKGILDILLFCVSKGEQAAGECFGQGSKTCKLQSWDQAGNLTAVVWVLMTKPCTAYQFNGKGLHCKASFFLKCIFYFSWYIMIV